MRHKSIRVLMLSAFSLQGGIEKFNRAFLHALYILSKQYQFQISADLVHDKLKSEQNYFPSSKINGFQGNKIFFFLKQCFRFFKHEVWILGHLNLAVLGVIRKMIAPSKPLVLICHGIEVFRPLKGFKKRVLKEADKILAVSQFTKMSLVHQHGVKEEKIILFPNTIDPFFKIPEPFSKPSSLLSRYHIKSDEIILFTLARMSSEEQYKGYDQVLSILPNLLKEGYNIKYVLSGKADDKESARISNLIKTYRIEERVILTGYLPENEIIDHYLLSDLFIMPSKGEGFGIVFLEAIACGVPVIAGNKDGSTEALQFGKLGCLVDPDNRDEIYQAVKQLLRNRPDPVQLQKEMLAEFSFDKYSSRTESFLHSIYQ